MTAVNIQHVPEQQRFSAQLGGVEAELRYRLSGQKVDFYRTFVPVGLRGQGVAERLVAAGLCWAGEQHLEISASCWYVGRFLSESRDRSG